MKQVTREKIVKAIKAFEEKHVSEDLMVKNFACWEIHEMRALFGKIIHEFEEDFAFYVDVVDTSDTGGEGYYTDLSVKIADGKHISKLYNDFDWITILEGEDTDIDEIVDDVVKHLDILRDLEADAIAITKECSRFKETKSEV